MEPQGTKNHKNQEKRALKKQQKLRLPKVCYYYENVIKMGIVIPVGFVPKITTIPKILKIGPRASKVSPRASKITQNHDSDLPKSTKSTANCSFFALKFSALLDNMSLKTC